MRVGVRQVEGAHDLRGHLGREPVGDANHDDRADAVLEGFVDFEGDAAADHHGGELIAAGGADVNFLVGHGVEHGEHVDVLPVGHDESAEGVRVQALPAFLGADAFIGVEIAHALQCMRCWARVRAAAGRCG